MRKKHKKRVVEDAMLAERVEPTFQDPPSTKPGSIRAISVEEYKKQIAAAKKADADAARLNAQHDQTEQYNQPYSQPKTATWKKIFSATIGIALVAINVALIYVEIQPKTMKPTLSVATPWGVAEVWTPWGADGKTVAQLDLRKIGLLGKESQNANSEVSSDVIKGENTAYYDK